MSHTLNYCAKCVLHCLQTKCPVCGSDTAPINGAPREETLRSSAWMDDMRRRVERAEDQILNATTKREKDHAIIRYETVRDILSAYDRKAEMSPIDPSSATPRERVDNTKGEQPGVGE